MAIAAPPGSAVELGPQPSWEDMQALLDQQTSANEKEALQASFSGRGRLRVDLAKFRLFNAKDESELRVTFYRDSAAWCPYCQKVQIALEEKRVPYRISKVNMNCYGEKPAEFLAKNPRGLLPVAEVDGRLITESNTILDVIEAKFQDVPLIPPGREAEVRSLLRLERQLFGTWFGWLRSGGDGGRKSFLQDLDEVERRLAANGGPYFLGAGVSVVECHFASFLERMAASLAYFKGFTMRRNPQYSRLEAWFEAMEARDSYAALAGDFYTHAHDLPPQVGTCAENGQNAEFRRAIDGQGPREEPSKSWRLPLPIGVPPSPLEVLMTGTAAEAVQARREAAAKLLRNHGPVLKFCLRGRGTAGVPPVGAPLADPRARPASDEQLSSAVDEALRGVVRHLLAGHGEAVPASCVGAAALLRRAELPACLGYMRDRVGVPRDMSSAAARQLRSHLNSYLEALASL